MELRPISPSNEQEILALCPAPRQTNFVASNAESLQDAQNAAAAGLTVLPLGLYEGETAVGFVLLSFGTTGQEEPDFAADACCIWRFMIGAQFQGRGLGAAALDCVLHFLRSFPHGKKQLCWLSYEPENAAAKALYHRFGFRENGEMVDSEVVAVLPLLP